MTTKQILTFLFILTVLLTSCGQTKNKSYKEKILLDLQTVERIEIRNYNGQEDSSLLTKKVLTFDQTKEFVTRWNNAKSLGLCKFIPKQWIDITLKDSIKRIFVINGQSIKENKDWCFDIGESDFLINDGQTKRKL
jgi:hypothetical protein